ncbi:ABC transporter substrate-binding protein [Streptomyces millisiae]|uniref:Sugar ABC transporter substrate-binding protein n=1 Tax=Streptomyces millisiae TaxID=3075542 RepID=A0ABU2LH99_9ACTN|nr:sugar ABC transporter substrate-binding protein [Streptomyces sp. DSM 44918]MDT0316965.1 sugar ABC transporter substrate-binding protein [Streptomyces sp. DSM 44918]
MVPVHGSTAPPARATRPPSRTGRPGPTRRGLLRAAAGGATAALLGAGCSAGGGDRDHITWAIGLDPVGGPHFQRIAREFMDRNPGVTIELTPVPNGDLNAWLVTRLAADRAPDIVNMGVSAVGRYTTNGGTVDIGDQLPDGFLDDYQPSLRALVEKDGGVFGIPQETNCAATYYRTDILRRIGVEPRNDLERAWTAEEIREIAVEAKRVTGAYGLSWGYINESSGNRWLPVLYMFGGSLFREDGRTPAIGDPEGIEALEWTRRLYADELIPASNTVKASQEDTAFSLFTTGQVGLMIHESQFRSLKDVIPDEDWSVDHLFRERGAATNLSGSVNVVTRSSRNPELAAEFLAFASTPERILARVRDSGAIAPYTGVTARDVGYAYRPDLVQRFIDQLSTVPPQMAREQAGPDYQAIRQLLGDFLDLMFIGSASARETADAIAEGLRNVRN